MPPTSIEEVSAELVEIKTGFHSLKELVEKSDAQKVAGEVKADVKEQLDRVETGISEHEKKYDELCKEFKEGAEERKTFKQKLEEFETTLSRPLAPGEMLLVQPEEERKELRNNFFRYCLKSIGHQNSAFDGAVITDSEREAFKTVKEFMATKALNVGTDTAGGYLVPEDYRAEMLKTITEFSPIRQHARVVQTGRDSVKWPKRTGQFAAAWVAELGTRAETPGLTFGLEDIPVHELYALIDISEQMLEDSAFDMESFLNEEAAEQFAVAEGSAFVNGNGTGKPEGFVDAAAGLATVNSGGATSMTPDALVNMFYTLKEAYARRSTWLLKRATVGVIRRMKDTHNQYLWQPGLQAGQPGMILGQPFDEAIDMTGPTSGDVFAASAKVIALGDWRRAYLVVDRISMSLLRDPFTQATSGNVRFIFRKRLGGQIIQTEAALLMTVAA